MPKSKQDTKQDHEKSIEFCSQEIAKYNQQIRELQASANHLVMLPDIRERSLQDLEAQLTRAKLANETAQEQAKMYRGTDLQEQTANDAIASSRRIRQLEKQINETRQFNAEQATLDDTKRAELEQQIERLFLQRDNLQKMLSRMTQERDEQHYNEGKKIYQSCMVDYQQHKQKITEKEKDVEQAYQNLETLQFDILKKLDSYPDLQKLFMQEHDVERSDGLIRVCLAAIGYIESLIADHLELERATTRDGRALAEILSLTDQEVLAGSYQGGLYNLQDKRSQLLDAIEQHQAMLQEPR